MARKSAGCKQAGENSAARHSSGHTARTLPRFDPRNESGGRQANGWVGGDLATHTAIVLSKDGRTSRCRGSTTSSPPGWSTQSASAARAGSRELLATPTYFVVVVGFLAVAVAGG